MNLQNDNNVIDGGQFFVYVWSQKGWDKCSLLHLILAYFMRLDGCSECEGKYMSMPGVPNLIYPSLSSLLNPGNYLLVHFAEEQ